MTADHTPLPVSGLYAFLPREMLELINASEFLVIVRKLQPILKLNTDIGLEIDPQVSNDSIIRVYHASFLDLIETETITTGEIRVNTFWTNPKHLHRNMAVGCLGVMLKGTRLAMPDKHAQFGLRFNMCNLETSHQMNGEVNNLKERIERHTSPGLLYSSLYWMEHLSEAHVDGDDVGRDAFCEYNPGSLSQLLNGFLHSERSLFWLELLSLMGNLDVGCAALINIIKQSGSSVSNLLGAFLAYLIVSAGTRTPRSGRIRDATMD